MSEFPCPIRCFNVLYPVVWGMKKRNLKRLKFKQKKNNLRVEHLTSEGVDDFRKNYPADWFQGNSCHTMALCVRRKNLSPEVWEKNSYMYPNQTTHTPPQKSNGHPLKKNWTKTSRAITKKAKGLKLINVVVNFLFQVILVFLLFLGMVMFANEVETKENKNYLRKKN